MRVSEVMALEINGDIFAGWARWKFGINHGVVDDIDCASIASDSIVGFGERIVLGIVDAELVGAIF